MDRRFLKPVRWLLLFEALFAGTSSMSRIFKETEIELEDTLNHVPKMDTIKKYVNANNFKDWKF
ncbi:MAG: hypothetical protein ACM3TR_20680 [Caulobacteraceae bacterium]